jgi:hypothetical protein
VFRGARATLEGRGLEASRLQAVLRHESLGRNMRDYGSLHGSKATLEERMGSLSIEGAAAPRAVDDRDCWSVHGSEGEPGGEGLEASRFQAVLRHGPQHGDVMLVK